MTCVRVRTHPTCCLAGRRTAVGSIAAPLGHWEEGVFAPKTQGRVWGPWCHPAQLVTRCKERIGAAAELERVTILARGSCCAVGCEGQETGLGRSHSSSSSSPRCGP